jgi:hypothetical protein
MAKESGPKSSFAAMGAKNLKANSVEIGAKEGAWRMPSRHYPPRSLDLWASRS